MIVIGWVGELVLSRVHIGVRCSLGRSRGWRLRLTGCRARNDPSQREAERDRAGDPAREGKRVKDSSLSVRSRRQNIPARDGRQTRPDEWDDRSKICSVSLHVTFILVQIHWAGG